MTASPSIVFLLPDLGGGGAQQVMLTLARMIDRARFSPRLMVLGTNTALATAAPQDIAIEHGQAARLRNALPWMVRRLRALRPALVISTLAYTNLALLAAAPLLPRATRLVVREANTPDATLASLPRFAGKHLYRRLYPRAAQVIAQTSAIANRLTEVAPGTRGRISIVPNPVDVERLRALAASPKRAPGAGLRLIGAGRLTHQKGFDRLIAIAARLPQDSRISIFGDGAEHASLSAQIAALGLSARVTLAGFVDDLPAHLAGADALVMPSRWEGLPNAALESLAVGTPVLASPEAALQDIAARAPRAVQIAASDDEFIGKLAPWPVAAAGALRKTLLPPDYEAAAVVRQLETIFTAILGGH